MIIKYLSTKNLYSFKELGFRFDKGLFLILGENQDDPLVESNYAGKSNIFESLVWGLYGKGTKEVKASGSSYSNFRKEQVVHRGEKEARATVTVEIDDVEYEIERTRNFTGTTLVIRQDGKEFSGKDVAETQKKVDSLLGMSYETFLQSVVFAQNSRRFTQATDREIKELLDEILNLHLWTKAHSSVSDLIKEAKREKSAIDRSNERIKAEISGLERALDLAETNYQEACDVRSEWEKKHLSRMQEIDNKIAFEKGRGSLGNVLDGDLKNQFEKVSEIYLQKTEKLNSKKATILAKEERLQDIERSLTSDECPLCEQPIGQRHLKDITNKYSTDKDMEELHDLLVEQETLEEQIKIFNNIFALLEEYKRLEGEPNPYPVPKKTDVKNLQETIEELKNKIQPTDTYDEQLRILGYLSEAFGNSGIKSLMIDNILPILNSRIQDYVSVLLSNTRVSFDTETELASGEKRDKFSVNIEEQGEETGYALCSNGQRKRIDFAVSLALQSLLPQTNIFLCDEPFEGIDSGGEPQVVELLRRYSEERNAGIYVITHLKRFQELFENVLTVVKKDRVSKVRGVL